jgi:hypothetical protein
VGNAAFPTINKQYPLYGAADGMSAEKWWTILIEDTMKEAGADPSRLSFSLLLASLQGFRRAKALKLLINITFVCTEMAQVMPTLAPRLIHRFASSEGYRAFDDAKPARLSSHSYHSFPHHLSLICFLFFLSQSKPSDRWESRPLSFPTLIRGFVRAFFFTCQSL